MLWAVSLPNRATAQQHLDSDFRQTPIAHLSQAVILFLLSKFAFDGGALALAVRIGPGDDLGSSTVFLHDDAAALTVGVQSLVVSVGVVAFRLRERDEASAESLVRCHLLGMGVN